MLSNISLSPALRSRISTSNPVSSSATAPKRQKDDDQKFVLYLPTVNLRMEHNPAFALACHIANTLEVPCIVLAVVLDDHSMPGHESNCSHNHPVVMTSRRLAFLLEALSESCQRWSDHGAGCAIRVHGPQCRSPDHLTLSSRAMAVVTDEPFVNPFLTFVQRVEKTCHLSSVPCFRVDGSTTVPPVLILKRKMASKSSPKDNMLYYTGVPSKAWQWQKLTEPHRKQQLQAALQGEFDAPELTKRIVHADFFMDDTQKIEQEPTEPFRCISKNVFPSSWRDQSREAPGCRPWTVAELRCMAQNHEIKPWALNWHGADSTVPPCIQTIGTAQKGLQRWNEFVRDRKGLVGYARKRTDPQQPHGSSRMSCYLNFGIVSIFQLVHEVKLAQSAKVHGADKFEEEIVKWREMSYAHAFSRGDYDRVGSVPLWARKWIDDTSSSQRKASSSNNFNVSQLETGTTDGETWNAMQQYLVRTGELHNNARMTWGKQIVSWGLEANHPSRNPTEEIVKMLVYLNDRYALDGLSPPSYAGLLWCVGWCDNPDSKGGGIQMKFAARYKLQPAAFHEAESILLEGEGKTLGNGTGSKRMGQLSILSSFQKQNKKIKSTIQM